MQNTGKSRQAFYQPLCDKTQQMSAISHLTIQAHRIRANSPSKGCRAMYDRFGSTLPIGRDKSIQLLMDLGFRVRYPKRYGRATQSGTREFANLLVEKTITSLNQVWQADMAHYLYGDRKYYTIYITDVYTQQIVGYGAFSTNMAVNYAMVLKQAIAREKKFTLCLSGLIHHSDGGKQYESMVYKKLCYRNNIRQSMCMYSYENPYAEKTNDLINNAYLNIWKPRSLKELSNAQRKAVNDHNTNSKKNRLGKLSPLPFKQVILNSEICKENHQLTLKPSKPEQPRKRTQLII